MSTEDKLLDGDRSFSIRGFAPNFVTMLAAASGITSIKYSVEGNWRWAVGAIFLACVFDGLDGRVARLLKVASKLGAELDSLSDFVCFGVAPGILVYKWMTFTYASSIGDGTARVLWALALFYALCCGFRLARFNVMLEQPKALCWKHFFMGLPAPGGAGLVMFPVVWEIEFGSYCSGAGIPFGVASLLVCGFLMACRLPTLSAKCLKIPRKWAGVSIILAILFIGMLVAKLWLTMMVVGVFYYISVPICIWVFLKLKRKEETLEV